MSKDQTWPFLGCGVGLRSTHYPFVLAEKPAVDFFEAVSENFLDTSGRPIHVLKEVRKDYELALHGVSLSIGSMDPLNETYLQKLKDLVSVIQPAVVSDHLCWTGVGKKNAHDLLPLPHTEESLLHVVSRVQRVQDKLGRKILLENVSSYVEFKDSTIPEWEFINEVARRSGCGILLDVNNIFVNAFNHGFSSSDYLKGIEKEHVGQVHLAGHADMGDWYFDTHDAPVPDGVWRLYQEFCEKFGAVSTLIEWDAKLPEFSELQAQADSARKIQTSYSGQKDYAVA